MLLKRSIQLFFTVIGAILGYELIPRIVKGIFHLQGWFLGTQVCGAILGAIIFFIATIWLANYLVVLLHWIEDRLKATPLSDVIGGTIGIVVGLLVAYLCAPAMRIVPVVGLTLQFFLTIFLGYLGLRIGLTRREDIMSLIVGKLAFRDRDRDRDKDKRASGFRPGEAKLLDTSVIIDGRIADLAETGFLDGILVIPEFVLEELQHIADSSDTLKRNRGRRGLDILNRIQKESKIQVRVTDVDFDDVHEVDSKLVKYAKSVSGTVVTNDFNLNKVCELQGVPVLNINDLANAIKPVVLPGEEMNVQVIKDGKEQNQGLAYLDDGTMIVIEGGRGHIGHTIDILVTSVLQTSAGRMIFARPKLSEHPF